MDWQKVSFNKLLNVDVELVNKGQEYLRNAFGRSLCKECSNRCFSLALSIEVTFIENRSTLCM